MITSCLHSRLVCVCHLHAHGVVQYTAKRYTEQGTQHIVDSREQRVYVVYLQYSMYRQRQTLAETAGELDTHTQNMTHQHDSHNKSQSYATRRIHRHGCYIDCSDLVMSEEKHCSQQSGLWSICLDVVYMSRAAFSSCLISFFPTSFLQISCYRTSVFMTAQLHSSKSTSISHSQSGQNETQN